MVSNMNEIVTANNTKEYIGNLWDKQVWETDKEYSYFIGYMNMNKRSHANIPNVTSPMNVDGSINLSPLSENYISNISVKNKWIERCNAFDLQKQNELALSLSNFKGIVIENEIDSYNILFSKYKNILENKINNTITIKELNQLVTLGTKIGDLGRRIAGLPEKYNAGVIEQNINTTNTERKIAIVEIRPSVNSEKSLSNSDNIINGEYTIVTEETTTTDNTND